MMSMTGKWLKTIGTAGVLVLGGAAAIVTNGASSATASGAQEINACALLDAARISDTLQRAVEDGRRKDLGFQSDGSYSSSCVWIVRSEKASTLDPTAPLGGRSFVILNATQWPPGSGLARTFLDAFRAAAAGGEIPSKPRPRDFGDEALWWGDGLAVRKGDVSFGLSVFLPGNTAAPATRYEEQLAPLILRRLNGPETVAYRSD